MQNEEPDGAAAMPLTARRPVKSEAAFRTISEVSEDLNVPQHVLRFWESKFTQIKPLKRGGGRRYYRPEDVNLLSHIRDLLYKDGYTIRGVQKLLREPLSARLKQEEAAELGPVGATSIEPDALDHEDLDDDILRVMLIELIELRRILAEARRK